MLDEWLSMVDWCNDSDKGKLKYWEKNLSEHNFVDCKSDMAWLGI